MPDRETGRSAGAAVLDVDPRTLSRDRLLVAVCRSGRRSREAAEQLLASGLDGVDLDGGLQAWPAAGHPLVTGDGRPGAVR